MKIGKIVIFDGMLNDECKQSLLKGILMRIPCFIHGTLYNMEKAFPYFASNTNGNRINAELLIVSESFITQIDIIVGCPSLCHKESIKVIFADGTMTDAATYVLNNLPDKAMPISGDNRSES